MSTLVFRYTPDPGDDFGWLSVTVETPAFSGTGGFWVQHQDLGDFAVSLAAYPIKAGSEPRVDWGFNQLKGADRIISIRISPADSRGTLLVDVEIADKDDQDHRVRTAFRTHYPEVELFSRAVANIATGQQEMATLAGD